MKKFSRKSIAIMLIVAIVAMIPICVYAASNTLKKPAIKSISVSGRQVTVKYGKVKNAKSYNVYRVTKNKKGKNVYKKVASSKNTTARFMGKYNTSYKLVVKAFKGKKSSKYSAAKTKKIGKSNTYVFFGSDSRATGDDWKNVKSSANHGSGSDYPRSDVIMILKVNPGKKTVDVVSIYRDTAMNVGKNKIEYGKINSAYGMYGPKEAVKILEKDLDIQVDGYIATNFKGVADAIDQMGGINLKIENDKILEPYATNLKVKTVPELMNKCIDEHKWLYGDAYGKHVTNSLIKKSGKLTGSQAVAYARVRYTDGSDKRRTVRQRTVLNAMVKKFKSLKKTKQLEVLKTIYPTVDTNMSNAQLLKLLQKVSTYSLSPISGKNKIAGFPFYKKDVYVDLSTKYIDSNGNKSEKAYVTMPCDVSTNVTTLHKKLYKESIYKPSSNVKSYSKNSLKKKSYLKKGKKYVQTTTSYSSRNKKLDNTY